MLSPFTFARTPVIHFGPGKISLLPKLVKPFGAHILLVTGSASFLSSPAWDALQQHLKDNKITWDHYTIDKEPTPAMIDQCVSRFREKKIEVVISIGGGSVMDAGKAISAMLPLQDSIKLYLEGIGSKIHPGNKVPFIAVPTTSGTGSETTKNAVLSEIGEQGFKKSLRHDNFVPEIAIVDPELTMNCPQAITAASGMDAFTQLLESYLSTAANPMTDSLAFGGLRCIQRSLLRTFHEGIFNLEARTEMAYASMISGITLANAGLGTVHGYASSLGGYFPIAHGVICSSLMAPTNSMNVKKLLKTDPSHWALKKYSEIGKLFSGKENQPDDYYIHFLMDEIEKMSLVMGIPKLSTYGLSQKDFQKVVKATENKNNPVKLNEDELTEILEKVI